MRTQRQIELDQRRNAQELARQENKEGFHAAITGAPIPNDASAAFKAGYFEGKQTMGEME